MDATVRVQPLSGQWETLGVERLRGIAPENIEASANDWGPDAMSFKLAAEEGARRPDLLPFTPIELEVGGMLVWSGFTYQRPSDANSYQVTCRGWQYHLDDDLFDRAYVHTRVSDYRDQRTFLTASLTSFRQAGQIANDNGVIVISWPNTTPVVVGDAVGVTLDLGPDSTAKRVVMTWDSSNNYAAGTCYCRGTDTESFGAGSDAFTFALNSGASGTSSGTFGTSRRYVHVILFVEAGGATTLGADVFVRIKSIQVFRDTAYESGNASILKADQVIKDALTFAPLLNQSVASIAAGTFSIPSYLTAGYVPPRDTMEAVNLLENYRLRIAGSDLKTLSYDVKPSAPLAEVGDWSGSQFSDASVSGEEIYDRAIVDASGPDSARIVSKRTQTGTLVDRRGYHRTRKVEPGSAVTQAIADRIADLWLTEHKTAPFSGTLKITGQGARRILSGTTIPPQAFLLYSGEKIRLANRVDPDTGAWGRDGRIAGVKYTHDDLAVEIAIDDQRKRFDQVLARYAALVGG